MKFRAVGYAYVFAVMTALHIVAIVYVFFKAKPIEVIDEVEGEQGENRAWY